ncbi:MAG: (Fe-S)-binding protein [Methermicoccaceae archaeon]
MREPSINANHFTSKQLLEFDACTRCSECMDWCPIYQEINEGTVKPDGKELTDEEKWMYSPKGRIQTMRKWLGESYGLRARIFGPKEIPMPQLEAFSEQSYIGCSTCGICKTVCESGIDTVNLWEATRANLVDKGLGPYGKQKAFPNLLAEHENVFAAKQSDRLCWLPPDIEVKDEAEVAYFVGCTAAYRMQKVAVASVRVLDELGVPFTLLGEEEQCCVSVLIRTGQLDTAAKYVKKNIHALKKRGVKKVVYACAGCVRTSALDWPKVWGGKLPFEVLTFAEYLEQLMQEGYDFNFKKPINKKVTYHDPCHSGRHMGVYDPPRNIIQTIPGIELVEMERTRELQRCCGAGGGIKAGVPELALAISRRRVQDAVDTGAETVLSTCPFCRRNIKDGINDMGIDMGMEDVMVLLAESMGLDTEIPDNPYMAKQM